MPAVETLRRVWVQQFYRESGCVYWRTEKEGIPPSGLFISSPYDVEARYAKKHTTSWVGYKVHVTETCEDDAPHIITHVETTAGPVSDGAATPHIHQGLARQGLLPAIHIVDTGYLDAELLVTSQREHGVEPSVRCVPIAHGKRKPRRGLTRAISRSIGRSNGPPARAGIPA